MIIQFPIIFIAIFIYLSGIATIGIVCMVIDTIVYIKDYIMRKQVINSNTVGGI